MTCSEADEKNATFTVVTKVNIEKNGQLFSKTCFGMLMPSLV